MSKKPDYDTFFDKDVEPISRTIFIGEEIREHSAERAIKGLYLLQLSGPGPITILINSPGGSVYHGLAIYDAIKNCGADTRAVVVGQASSMASVILQAAERRYLAPNSTVMVHLGTDQMEESHAEDFQRRAKESRRLDEVVEDIYLSRIKISKTKLRQLLRFDTYLPPMEAIEMGFADGIWSKKK